MSFLEWFGRNKPERDRSGGLVRSCSFCNKSQRDVRKLIAGPNVYICDECVDICLDIVVEDRKDQPERRASASKDPEPTWDRSSTAKCTLCRLPVAIIEAIVVENRGLICPGCRGAIEAAIARKDE